MAIRYDRTSIEWRISHQKIDAIVIKPVGESHFFSELLSFESINGMKPEDILPAIMITTIHPSYFLKRDEQRCLGEPIPEDELIFIQLKEICPTASDVINVIEKIFSDIRTKKNIRDFEVANTQKAGVDQALTDALILKPSFMGFGIDLKEAFAIFKSKNA